MLRRHSALVGSLVASFAAVAMPVTGCAQVLGIDDRSVGADGGAQTDGTTKPDGRGKDAASHVDGKSGSDATVKPDGGAHVDAADGGHPADHHVADVGTNGDAASDGGVPQDASDAARDASLTTCDGGAFNLETDPNHCGACENVCPSPEAGIHNEEPTCASGTCGLGCDPGYGNCNDGGAGCTYDLSILPANCGVCGNMCGNGHTTAAPTCASGACVFQCATGYMHCTAADNAGCETNTYGDSDNCGSCGYKCGTGVACFQGFCQLATGVALSQQLGLSALVQDSTKAAGGSLYWVADSTPRVIQTVPKSGSPVTTVATTNPPNASSASSLSVDENNVYYFATGPALDEVSTAGTTGTNIAIPGFAAGSGPPQGVVCDGDLTHTATTVFFAFATSGLYRVTLPPSSANQIYLADAWPIQGMALWDDTLYFAAGQSHGPTYIEYATTTQTATNMPDFATFSGGATAIATDGVNVYVMGNTPNVITAVSIATMNTSTLATNSPGGGQGNLATDGTNLYISGTSVYRIPVTATNVDLSMATPMFSATALGESTVTGMVVDDTNLYISTSASIYKTKK